MMKRILTLLLAVLLGAAIPAGAEETFMPNTNPIPDPMIEIPAEYKRPAEQQGTLIRLEYDTWESFTYESHSQRLKKVAWVYLPYGYDEGTPYNIFYISHGGWSNEETVLGTDAQPLELKHAVDHAIQDGDQSLRRCHTRLEKAEGRRHRSCFPTESGKPGDRPAPPGSARR